MILANLSDGSTLKVDLSDNTQHLKLTALLRARKVRGLSILSEAGQFALPLPKGFRKHPLYGAELIKSKHDETIGEIVFSQADDVRVSLTRTFKSKLVRCDLIRIGKLRFSTQELG